MKLALAGLLTTSASRNDLVDRQLRSIVDVDPKLCSVAATISP